MRGFIAITCIFASAFVTCSVAPKKNTGIELSSIRLKEVMQFVNLETMQIADFGRKFDISYYDDLILYHIADTTYAELENSNNAGRRDTLTSPYLVYRKGQLNGHLYKFLHSTDYKTIRVDSMLNKMLSFRDVVFRTDTRNLVDSARDQSGGLLEKYVPKVKTDQSFADTGYFYYTKDLSDVEFSLSPQLDKAKGMKLVLGRFVYLSSIDSASKKAIPQREISFQISRQSLPNKENVIQFLERAKKNL